jgi:hypothetical protein
MTSQSNPAVAAIAPGIHRTSTLFCGDMFSRTGPVPALTHDTATTATAYDQLMHGRAVTAATAPSLRQLAQLQPERLALMYGPTFVGNGAHQLRVPADHFESCWSAAA